MRDSVRPSSAWSAAVLPALLGNTNGGCVLAKRMFAESADEQIIPEPAQQPSASLHPMARSVLLCLFSRGSPATHLA